MSTNNENSENNLYIFEKDGVLIKKVTYKSNLLREINDHSGGRFADLLSHSDVDGALEIVQNAGYKIYQVQTPVFLY